MKENFDQIKNLRKIEEVKKWIIRDVIIEAGPVSIEDAKKVLQYLRDIECFLLTFDIAL